MTAGSSAWVALTSRFTPGWPWPEDSYGLDPVYGADGWCRGCGSPTIEQLGDLVIQGAGFPAADVWMPNWRYDVVCVSAPVARDLQQRFDVELRDVRKPRTGPTGVQQLLAAPTLDAWYRPAELAVAVRERHREHSGDQDGATCGACGRWKWLPVSEDAAPIIGAALRSSSDVIASPEEFGDGLSSFRHLLFRRPLAEALVAANPRHWRLVEVRLTGRA